MERKETHKIISDHLSEMKELYGKIISNFDRNDIHDFRVEVKKLRAFLRLLNSAHKPDKRMIPKSLKAFYNYVGIIRNIQLHRHGFLKNLANNNIQQPAEYFKMLATEEDCWKRKVIAWQDKNDIDQTESTITERCPAKLTGPALKKFVANKKNELNRQLHDVSTDEAMHHIRKILKDLVYTDEYIKEDTGLPETLASKEHLKMLTDWLGDFMDKCIQIDFLSNEYVDPLNSENEKVILHRFREQVITEKLAIKEMLNPHLDKLSGQLNADTNQ